MSIEFNASGQALTAKYHIVHSFIIRELTRTTAAEFCCPPKYVQNKRWLNFQLEELWSNTKSNKYPYSQNQRSVKIEVNKFWVEPGTPENYVIRLHPFIELWYRIKSGWSEPGGGSSLVLMALRWTPGLRLRSGALATVWGGTWPCLTSAATVK